MTLPEYRGLATSADLAEASVNQALIDLRVACGHVKDCILYVSQADYPYAIKLGFEGRVRVHPELIRGYWYIETESGRRCGSGV